jgi:Demerecviridae HNH endonuclease
MIGAAKDLTAARLRELLLYDPDTGIFTWVKRSARGSHIRAGHMTGGIDKSHGYRTIGIDGHTYLAHRLAWLWMTGKWPVADVDHRDLERENTRWHNLREATRSQNNTNVHKRANNTSGFKGVRWNTFKSGRGKWGVRIAVGGKKFHLGYFNCLAMATIVADVAAVLAHGEYARVDASIREAMAET